jgi:ubiquinone/menaquinone biosynthesis C-methylase UbiE
MEIKMEVFFEIHSDNPREGPGNFDSTKRAFELLTNLPEMPSILDIGCGPGKQTIDLLKISNANIRAIDNHQPFLDTIQNKIKHESIGDRLQVFNMDMSNLDFQNESFDVIWSEGAIYNIGFKNGLLSWMKLLKSRGYIAVTEATWLKENPPPYLLDFWNTAYPAIQSINDNLEIIKKSGYKRVDHFILPESAWWEYYNPIINKLPYLKQKYASDEKAMAVIEEEEKEIELYRKYSEFYGYVFYIMQKP